MTSNLKIFITAGEASGDLLGAKLMESLKALNPSAEFYGVGGSAMEKAGLKSLFPMNDLSVMGIFEVLPRLRKILKIIKQTIEKAEEVDPDIVITIDSPDFSFRVTKGLKQRQKLQARFIHYVAPTVWAWRPERAEKLASLYDGVLCLFPFEPPYFQEQGMDAFFCGHSALDNLNGLEEKAGALRQKMGIKADEHVFGILFGSRIGELNRIGPTIRQAALKLAEEKGGKLVIVSPTLPHLRTHVKNLLEGFPCRVEIIDDPAQKWPSFGMMDSAVAVSGTVGLELGLAGVPHMIAYKMNGLTWSIVRKKVTVKYAHLVNILLDRPLVPECIQDDCKPDLIFESLRDIAGNAKRREIQCLGFGEVREMIKGSAKGKPAEQAAGFIMSLTEQAKKAA